MPTEPMAEPTLEELSAYLDHELDGATQARVAEHLSTCAECQLRLDGLRETAYAVRALPMETPPRTFTIPAQQRQPFRWAPVGWVGGIAAAVLAIGFGLSQLHFHGPAGTASTSTAGGSSVTAPYGEVAPLNRSYDSAPTMAQHAGTANSKTAADPQSSARSMTISTDAGSYSASGVITIHVTTRGLSADEASSVRILLTRQTGQGGYAVRLAPPSDASTYPFDWEAAYSIPQMHLPTPVAGTYSLQVTIDKSDHQSLNAWLPVTITP